MTDNIFERSLAQMGKRYTELRPLATEYEEIGKALEGMVEAGVAEAKRFLGMGNGAAPRVAKKAKAKVKAAAKRGRAAKGRAGRGSHPANFVATLEVAGRPLSMVEIAGELGVEPSYLYRVAAKLQKDKKIKKKGKTYLAVSGGKAPVAAKATASTAKKAPKASKAKAAPAKKKPAAKKTGPKKTAKRKPRGQLQADVVRVVGNHPEGINVAGIAKELGMKSNPLYTVAGRLQETGRVKKKGKLLVPA